MAPVETRGWEDTGAFPNVIVSEDSISFTGSLDSGDSANFVFFAVTGVQQSHTVTVRQSAVYAQPIPALDEWALMMMALLLAIAGFVAVLR